MVDDSTIEVPVTGGAVVPKRLIVCCDGTWNTADQAISGHPSPTNVTKLRDGPQALAISSPLAAGCGMQSWQEKALRSQVSSSWTAERSLADRALNDAADAR